MYGSYVFSTKTVRKRDIATFALDFLTMVASTR